MTKNTDELLNILDRADAHALDEFLQSERSEILEGSHPFSDFMRKTLEAHGVRQQQLFLEAGLSQQFGYRLIAQRKHTRQRDTILKLCIAGRFTLGETQRALRLYGLSPLYVRIPRDAVLIKAFQEGRHRIDSVNELLEQYQMPLLE